MEKIYYGWHFMQFLFMKAFTLPFVELAEIMYVYITIICIGGNQQKQNHSIAIINIFP